MDGNQFGSFFKREFHKVFLIFPKVALDLMFQVIHTLLKSDTFTELNYEVYQSIRAFIIKKDMKVKKRKHLENFIRTFAENGFSIKFHRNIPNYTNIKLEKRGDKDGFAHYDGLQDYIEANTMVTALRFDKLDYLFRIYFAALIFILLVNLTHYYIMKILFSK